MQLHIIRGYIQHIYLIADQGGLLLLDGCSRADVTAVCRFIQQQLNRPLSDLKLVLVTHMHPDHAGGAHKLRRLTGANIACHPKAQYWYGGFMGRCAHLIDVSLTWWVAKRLGKPKRHIWYNPILKPDLLLEDGQRLPGFPDWQIIYTPGHTDHDVSVLHQPSRQLYIADLIVSVKKRLVPPYPVCHPNQYKQSLQRVASLKPAKLYFAHLPARVADTIDFDDILSQAPTLPKNHWHSTRNRILHTLGRQTRQH
ncbi:MBL fold metallo-hydrolase [Arsukibacterium indicum]|uniref:MBL fold metallo-hydrolase n=1 Tax=Arsukibacterium indicum TaxID=2848612 RepID=A0ABS6MPP0_9GAMM|nr:MBL fold metallo-hydrolase [Arsukibacterium indicum]MBV2130790.1 MBL fold metallo-hydrolase [Arsukibacterium indicum]